MERKDWFNVARALLTWQFWFGCCTAEQGYRRARDTHATVSSTLAHHQDSLLAATLSSKHGIPHHCVAGGTSTASTRP